MEETTKMTGFDDPIREKMLVTTDENGRLKMLSLRSRARQHDDEADSSANTNLSRPKLNSQFPRQQTPDAKPMVLRQALPHSNTGHFLVIPVTQPLTGHIQNSSNTLPELCVPVLIVVSVASTSVP